MAWQDAMFRVKLFAALVSAANPLGVDDQLHATVAGAASGRGVGYDRMIRAVRDEEELPLSQRRAGREEVKNRRGSRRSELVWRAPRGLLQWLGIDVSLDADEVSGKDPINLGCHLREQGRAAGEERGAASIEESIGRHFEPHDVAIKPRFNAGQCQLAHGSMHCRRAVHSRTRRHERSRGSAGLRGWSRRWADADWPRCPWRSPRRCSTTGRWKS